MQPNTIDIRLAGAQLREARESAGLTQVQLGRALGVPQQDLSRAEAGFSAVRVLEAIRHALEEGAPAERPLGRGGRPRAT